MADLAFGPRLKKHPKGNTLGNKGDLSGNALVVFNHCNDFLRVPHIIGHRQESVFFLEFFRCYAKVTGIVFGGVLDERFHDTGHPTLEKHDHHERNAYRNTGQ